MIVEHCEGETLGVEIYLLFFPIFLIKEFFLRNSWVPNINDREYSIFKVLLDVLDFVHFPSSSQVNIKEFTLCDTTRVIGENHISLWKPKPPVRLALLFGWMCLIELMPMPVPCYAFVGYARQFHLVCVIMAQAQN